jgi:hypothetical protein
MPLLIRDRRNEKTGRDPRNSRQLSLEVCYPAGQKGKYPMAAVTGKENPCQIESL